jgi:pilus assembly protein Flp/PilA
MEEIMKKLLVKFIRDEEGAAAAEYALILTVLVLGIAAAAVALGTNVSTAIQSAADRIATPAAP